MLGFNGAGPPGGAGRGTGRGLGPCGLGLARGRVFGRGRRIRRYFNLILPQNKAGKIKSLSEYEKSVEEELEDIKKEKKELQS